MAYNRRKREQSLKEKQDSLVNEIYLEDIRERLKRESNTWAGCTRVTIVLGTVMVYCGAIIFFIFILIAR